jgi:HlyD family secretion protein
MISATGTVEPEEVVDVGAQVAGQILYFGADNNNNTIDYGSFVKKGAVLAQIDDTLYTADVENYKAQVQQAIASQSNANANVLQMKAKLMQAEADWRRAQTLGPSQALAPTSYDQYKANYEVAKANVALAAAGVELASAALAQAKAALGKAKENLAYCTVKSPVDGVVIDRRVNIGQTVVSSLNTPSLFLIAKDLKRIRVWVSVNEADIGNIHPGQPVTFTVDAFPDEVFRGLVGKIRLNATMSQNVVTYTVEVNTNNADGKLLPYLTANAQFEIGRRENVVLVPNAALRWTPRSDDIAPESKQAHETRAGSPRRGSGTEAAPSQSRGIIWLEQGEFVRPLNVEAGLTDGTWTEVKSDSLNEELRVVTGEGRREPGGSPNAGGSPFMPQIRPRGPNQGGGPR